MEKLNYLNGGVTLNFNLREPKKVNGTTNVYAVIKVQGKQIKVPINAKVNPWQWDSRKQTPKITGNMTEQDRANNMQINSIINDVRMTFFAYICSGEEITESGITETIKQHLNNSNDMANKNAVPPRRTVTATKLLQEAFTKRYGTEESPKVANRSWYEYSRHLQYFFDYLKQPNIYDSLNALTAQSIYNYYEYQDKIADAAQKTIAQRCNTIILLINDIVANPNYQKYNLKQIQSIKKKNLIKKAEKPKRAITDTEIKAVNDLDLTYNEKLATYRDIFNVQLQSGVRFEDLYKLFIYDYKVSIEDGQEMQTVFTDKESITAVIIVNETIKNLQTKYSKGLPFKLDEKPYNKAIKQLFEMAQCTYKERFFIEKHGVKIEKNERFCDFVTNHYARHTFITQKLLNGWSCEKVAYLTGHASDQVIKQIYEHLTEVDKAKQVIKELRKIENESKSNETYSNANAIELIEKGKEERNNELIKECKDVLLYLGANYADIRDINDIDTLLYKVNNEYVKAFEEIGINIKQIKDIYNSKANFEQKQFALKELVELYKEKYLTKE